MQRSSIEDILEKHLSEAELQEVKRVLFRQKVESLTLPQWSSQEELEVRGWRISTAIPEETRPPRDVRVGILQHFIGLDTNMTIKDQRDAILYKIEKYAIHAARRCGVQILFLQEAWMMPFTFCTTPKYSTCAFSERSENGQSAMILSKVANDHGMVIVSPILERDSTGTFWNTCVVFESNGQVMGKHRKMHISGGLERSTFTGHSIFLTSQGRITIDICHSQNHPLNWTMSGTGPQIVFNPCATIGALSKPLWGVEARCAATANNYFTCAINRVGTETFPRESTSGNGEAAHRDFGHFYGSSYVSAPDGTRTPGLSRDKAGLLVAELKLITGHKR